MGCHTWVYANRKPYDENPVQEEAERMFNETVGSTLTLQRMNDILNEDEAIRLLTDFGTEYWVIVEGAGSAEERKSKLKEFRSSFEEEHGEDIYSFIETTWWVLAMDEEDIPFYKQRVNGYLNECRPCSLEEFTHTAFERVYKVEESFILLEDSFYATEVGFHDVFRVYGYPDDVLTSREQAEAFLYNRESQLRMFVGQVDKSVQYDEFVRLVGEILDNLYNQHPDAVISFG